MFLNPFEAVNLWLIYINMFKECFNITFNK